MHLSDPDVLDMIAKFVGVNVVTTLVLAVLSYVLATVMLDRLAAFDRWLDPSRMTRNGHSPLKNAPNQSPEPMAPSDRDSC